VSLLKFVLPQSIFDFSYLFGSNIFKKILGFLREVILAFIFGSSLIYASYLLLKTLSDFLSQFTFGNALQANLLPKFSKYYKDNDVLNLNSVYVFSKKIILIIFSFSLILQLLIVFLFIKKFYLLLIGTSFVLALVLSVNFYNSLFLSVIQAKGDFKKFSIATTFNVIIATFFVYPLSFLLDVLGIAISRLLGALSLSYFYIKPIVKPNNGVKVSLSINDFNFSVVFLANVSLFILLISRFISGLNGDSDITYFNYAFVLLNVVLTAIVFNINTIILRKISIKKEMRYLIYSILVSCFISCILYFLVNKFSIQIIDLIFRRGAFNENDVLSTAYFLRSLTPAYIILIFTTVIFQPFFSLGINKISKVSLKYLFFLVSIILLLLGYIVFAKVAARDACFLFINFMSITSLVISLFSLRYFMLYED